MVVRDRTPSSGLMDEARGRHGACATGGASKRCRPFLNTLGGADPVTMLLDRLCKAIGADGVALVHFGRFRSTVLCASERRAV